MEVSFQPHAPVALPLIYWFGGWLKKKWGSLDLDRIPARTLDPVDSRYTNYSNPVSHEQVGLLGIDSYKKSTFLIYVW